MDRVKDSPVAISVFFSEVLIVVRVWKVMRLRAHPMVSETMMMRMVVMTMANCLIGGWLMAG